MNELDIIIVNYNTAGQVIECLNALPEAVSGHRCSVTVVDNNSTADPDMERLCGRDDCEIIRLGDNFGFGYANNRGVEATAAPLILFLNPDTIPEPRSIATMIEYMGSNADVGVLGCNLLDAEGKPTHSFSRVKDGFFLELSFALGRLPVRMLYGENAEYNHTKEAIECVYICGADLMTRREAIEKSGGFDESFFMYYEDQDLCLRIKKAGYRVVCIPTAMIKHLEGKSFTLHENRERMIQTSRVKFYRKHHSVAMLWMANAMNVVLLGLGIMACKIMGNAERKKKYRYRLGLILGMQAAQ